MLRHHYEPHTTSPALNRQPFPKRRPQGGNDAHGAVVAQSKGLWVITREHDRGGVQTGPQQCLERKCGAHGVAISMMDNPTKDFTRSQTQTTTPQSVPGTSKDR
jgi:hypothetical protein